MQWRWMVLLFWRLIAASAIVTLAHSNIASGVLRGTWGVEPSYGSASFNALPTGYTVKRAGG